MGLITLQTRKLKIRKFKKLTKHGWKIWLVLKWSNASHYSILAPYKPSNEWTRFGILLPLTQINWLIDRNSCMQWKIPLKKTDYGFFYFQRLTRVPQHWHISNNKNCALIYTLTIYKPDPFHLKSPNIVSIPVDAPFPTNNEGRMYSGYWVIYCQPWMSGGTNANCDSMSHII